MADRFEVMVVNNQTAVLRFRDEGGQEYLLPHKVHKAGCTAAVGETWTFCAGKREAAVAFEAVHLQAAKPGGIVVQVLPDQVVIRSADPVPFVAVVHVHTPNELSLMTLKTLRTKCGDLDLDTDGSKEELCARLLKAYSKVQQKPQLRVKVLASPAAAALATSCVAAVGPKAKRVAVGGCTIHTVVLDVQLPSSGIQRVHFDLWLGCDPASRLATNAKAYLIAKEDSSTEPWRGVRLGEGLRPLPTLVVAQVAGTDGSDQASWEVASRGRTLRSHFGPTDVLQRLAHDLCT